MRAPIDNMAMFFWRIVRVIGRVLKLPIMSQHALVKRIHIERKQK